MERIPGPCGPCRITEFQTSGDPLGITAGSDGNLWFTELLASKIGRITPAGDLVGEYPTPTANSLPRGITLGPDGNVWYVAWNADKIGRVTPAGVVAEFALPGGEFPVDIAAGPDGNLWFTYETGTYNKPGFKGGIGRLTPP